MRKANGLDLRRIWAVECVYKQISEVNKAGYCKIVPKGRSHR